MSEWIQIETQAGTPIQAAGARLVLFDHVVRLRFPGSQGGLVWKRPASVLVTAPDGEETILPIRDETRQMQIGILLAGVLAAWLLWLIRRRD